MSRRRGASIVEAIVALFLGLFVMHLGLLTMHRLDRFEERVSRRHDALLSARITRTVLRGELARGQPARDWSVAADSLALRAFRGMGVVCGAPASAGTLVVAYSGDRRPDPEKDSVELTHADGTTSFARFDGAVPSSAACALATPAESVDEWTLDPPAPGGAVVARVFESGSYHLAGSALRYRIGAGGRQPLTPEVWSDGATGLTVRDSTVVLELGPLPGYGPHRAGFLAWRVR